jgi:hypothetical protein
MDFEKLVDDKISEVNRMWKSKFKEKRIEWVGSMKHDFLKYLENVNITDLFIRENETHQFYIYNYDHLIRIRKRSPKWIFLDKKGEESKSININLGVSIEESRQFYETLFEMDIENRLIELEQVREKVFMEKFIEKYSGQFKSKIEDNDINPYVNIDNVKIDLSKLYENFKMKTKEKIYKNYRY